MYVAPKGFFSVPNTEDSWSCGEAVEPGGEQIPRRAKRRSWSRVADGASHRAGSWHRGLRLRELERDEAGEQDLDLCDLVWLNTCVRSCRPHEDDDCLPALLHKAGRCPVDKFLKTHTGNI